MVAATSSSTPSASPNLAEPSPTTPPQGTFAALAEQAKCKAKAVQQQTEEFAQKNPSQALAIACGIGFVAGLILKRR